MRQKFIPILPKNYRSIALYAISVLKSPRVFVDKKEIADFTDRGFLTQSRIRKCVDFEILEGKEHVLGFHDHPNEMWITEKYYELAQYCSQRGWLKIQGAAS